MQQRCQNQTRLHGLPAAPAVRLQRRELGRYGDGRHGFNKVRYCAQNKITFARSRPDCKNDNWFVEQKDYSIVRRAVGHSWHDTPDELQSLSKPYAMLRLYTYYFQPSMKLIEKTRTGSKVRGRYDTARTPCRRVLESGTVPYKVNRLQDRLDALAQSKHKTKENVNLEQILT